MMESLSSIMQTLLKTNKDFPEKLKQRLVLESSFLQNPFKFIVGLFNEGVLTDDSNDPEATFGLKEMIIQLVMMIVYSKGPDGIGGLMKAMDGSGNLPLIARLWSWVKEDYGIEAYCHLIDMKRGGVRTEPSEEMPKNMKNTKEKNLHSTKGQASKEKPKAQNSKFLEQVPSSSGIKKVANLNYQLESSLNGSCFAVELDQFRMITRHTDGRLKQINWQDTEEKTIRFGVHVKGITWFQYDEEIIILGTSEGTVYLFDRETAEEKWTIRLGDPVHSLKFVDSTLVVVTRNADIEKFWWIDICRPGMRLLNQRAVESWSNNKKTIFFVDPNYSFLYVSGWLRVYSTQSGKWVQDSSGLGCYLDEPANITAFNVVDLMTTKTNFIAGCEKGHIDMWDSSKFKYQQRPMKTLRGHQAAVVSVCALSGHLLSLDQSGKLLMWSGYDLENKNVDAPVPRVLAEDFCHVGGLVAYERWFASIPRVLAQGSSNAESLISYKRWFGSSSPEDATIGIWTLPDLWLRTG